MKKTVLVTGCAGFVGSNLVLRLLGKGYRVVGIDDLSSGAADNISDALRNKDFVFLKKDIARESTLRALARSRINIVMHLAAYKIPLYESARKALLVNSKGTEHILEFARTSPRKKIVFTSTSDVYGKNTDFPFSEEKNLVLGPPRVKRWAYAASKVFDEHLCLAYAADFKIPLVILRYFNTYGPRHPVGDKLQCGPHPLFITKALRDEAITIYGDGSQRRCFCYIDDTVEGTVRAMEKSAACGEIINIGNNKTEISILALARLVRKLSGVPGAQKITFIPHKKAFGTYEEVSRRIPDISKAKRLLNFTPRVSNAEGIAKTIAWQRAYLKRTGHLS
jgi:UDP-glucose 4-epimerase